MVVAARLLVVAGLVVAGLVVAGLVVAGLVVAGMVLAGLVVKAGVFGLELFASGEGAEALPRAIDAAGACGPAQDGREPGWVARSGQGDEMILRPGKGESDVLACGGTLLLCGLRRIGRIGRLRSCRGPRRVGCFRACEAAVMEDERLAEESEGFGEAFVPEGVLEGQRHHGDLWQVTQERVKACAEGDGARADVGEAALWCDPQDGARVGKDAAGGAQELCGAAGCSLLDGKRPSLRKKP